MKITSKLFALAAFLFTLASCNNSTVYSDSADLPENGWKKDSAVTFNIPVKDTAADYRLMINVRNNNNYKYQNLWLFIQYQLPDKSIKKDTVECFLADNTGRWIGSGFGSLSEMNILYVPRMRFHQMGNYRYQIKQGMRDSVLTGLNDIGMEVLTAKENK